VLQLEAEAPRLAEYQAYIDFEMKLGDPARIQLIFERALVDFVFANLEPFMLRMFPISPLLFLPFFPSRFSPLCQLA
jgi:hypothetical protein